MPLFPVIMFLIIVLVFFHFSYLYFIGFLKDNRIGSAFTMVFQIGVMKIRYLLLPYFFMIVLFMLLGLLAYPFQFINTNLEFLVAFLLFMVYLAWARFYLSKVVSSL